MTRSTKILTGGIAACVLFVVALVVVQYYSYTPAYIPVSTHETFPQFMGKIKYLSLTPSYRGKGVIYRSSDKTKPRPCKSEFVEGGSVTLTATPCVGYYFAGWEWVDAASQALAAQYAESNCAGFSGVCTFTMHGNMKIRAIFLESGGGGGM